MRSGRTALHADFILPKTITMQQLQHIAIPAETFCKLGGEHQGEGVRRSNP